MIKEHISVVKANYLVNFNILLFFSDGKQKIVNFHPLLAKYAKGYYAKYSLVENFRKLKIKNGNIHWGKDEDIIFPVSFLYKNAHGKVQKEEILYVI